MVLTGEGADEVFAGYDIFKEASSAASARAAALAHPPASVPQLYPYLPGLQAAVARISGGLLRRRRDAPRRSAVLASAALPRRRRRQDVLLGRPARELAAMTRLAELRAGLPQDFARWHPLHQAQYLETALPAARLHPVVPGRPHGDGAWRRGPLSLPRPSRWSSLRRASRRAEAQGPEREAHPARGDQGSAAGAIGNRTKQPYRAPDSQSFVGSRRTAYVARPVAPARSPTRPVQSQGGGEAPRQMPAAGRHRVSATMPPSSASCRRSSGTQHFRRRQEPRITRRLNASMIRRTTCQRRSRDRSGTSSSRTSCSAMTSR